MGRPFFPIFFNNRDMLQYMSYEQRGQLFTQLFEYAESGVLPQENDGILGMAFSVFRKDIDNSAKKYQETCEKNRRNVAKRWEQQKSEDTSVYDGIRSNTNGYDSIRTDTKAYQKYQAEAEAETEAEEEAEGEGEEEAEAETEAEDASGASAGSAGCIADEFYSRFGRTPSDSFLHRVDQMAFPTEVVCAALDESGKARNPEGYATTILRRWKQNGVPDKYRPQRDKYNPPPDEPLADWERDWLMQMQKREEITC